MDKHGSSGGDHVVTGRPPRSRRRVRPDPRWIITSSAAVAVLAVTLLAPSGPGPGHRVAAAGLQGTGPVPAIVGPAVPSYPTVARSAPGAELDARVANAAGLDVTSATSSIWAGYGASGGPFTSVSTSWTQPRLSCAPTVATESAFWAGLDSGAWAGLDGGSQQIEQTGTAAYCTGGFQSYDAWYQIYPGPPFTFPGTVEPGDIMSASVTYDGNDMFTLTLSDTTQGWTQTTNQSQPGAYVGAAEVFAENPDGGDQPLSDFGSVSFAGVTVDNQPIGDQPNVSSFTIQSDSATAKSSPLTGGNGFCVSSSATPCTYSPPPTPDSNDKVLEICSDLPNATQAEVVGFNQWDDIQSQIWNLNQPWPDYDGQNWNCALTETDDVDWWWSPDYLSALGTPQVDVLDNNQNEVAQVRPFQGTSGWYSDTGPDSNGNGGAGSYYVCFITQADQPSC